ncbi:3-hydroxyacyl-[acyl-carrier-protein] dehydratase [Gelidibacter algens]|uniref:3-hydroxyacyl-[acyl-carrier-protein] dehydratase n=1 Tax=Gelidibacter algens TaxID=49280 RepID=A0A1A7R5D0_9FLAO|nr:beta-hydroxyacyl-ACP dehydratase [Gelidibacter algens]OBX26679.1 hydroxymyristoyl-ACP dehydratase [Gelidibacter algens]RAJ25742.1 3-hydroxyacyl-[acyl-carrier-protein] dehydratase [Gelidibacter algens]
MTIKEIIKILPYESPFHFVDGLSAISDDGVTGHYTFKETEFFYAGHFKENPITPGVILTECMAQIGLVCLGIYLMRAELSDDFKPQIALTSSQVDFFLPVFPGEKVSVISEKEVFRFNKLKCKVKLFNEKNELICRGTISGMLKPNTHD